MKRFFLMVISLFLFLPINVLADLPQDFYFIDFETDKGWIAAGSGQGKFEIGVPIAFSTRGGECKTTCLGTGPSGDHSEVRINAACTNLDGYMGRFETLSTNSLTSPVYNFSGKTNINLKLWKFMEIEGNNYDFCYYQYKNNPTGLWTTFETYGATRTDDNSWGIYTKNLSSLADGQSYFQLRFYCTTDDWTEGSGLCIDDINITAGDQCVPDCSGYVCGMDPVCGTLNCDNPGCTGGDTCENGVCTPCVPNTCASLGYECGVHDDGCGGVTPDCGTCAGEDMCQNGICRQSSKGIILVQLDDTSPEQLDTANLAVEKFHNEGIALTPELWPAGLSTSPLLSTALLWDSWPEIEIAQGVYNGDSCGSSLVADIQKGKLEYATAGITQPTSYLPHMCYPSSSALDGLRDEGILIVIDYAGPDVVRSGDPSDPAQQPLTIDGGRDIVSSGVDSYSTVLSSVQSQITRKGYADLAFHVWIIDESTSQEIITIMKKLREEGYTFMTATEYYRFLWGGGSSCGNGIFEVGEQCDDGNILNGDGCSGNCQIEGRGAVIFGMDDLQRDWLEDIAVAVTEINIEERVDIVLNVIPYRISTSDILGPKLQEWNNNYPNLIEIAEHGYTHNGNEYDMGSMSYNQQWLIIENGLNELNLLGIEPKSFTPPGGDQNANTLNVLRDLGFHTDFDCWTGMDSASGILVFKQCSALLCDVDGVNGPNCNFKSTSALMSDIDDILDNYGYALVAFHMQDFETSSGNLDTSKVNEYTQLLRDLKDSEKYQFMTAEEFYQGTIVECGNGILETGEECDDGNNINGDGCSSDCRLELSACVDNDNDGYYAIYTGCLIGNDCDDNNNIIYPGALETGCDAVNNDCDSLIDEDYVESQTTCGVGACEANGLLRCVAGIEVDSCIPGTPAANDSSCDGIDDDCDGTNDEDYASQQTTCGVGACYSSGSTSCVAGSIKDSCTPGTPEAEICNNRIDDDCDGDVDLDDSDCQICGDGICNGYESCSSCPEDCGECPVKTLIIRPNAPGSRRGWTNVQCNSGVNEWQCVDEDPAVTTDYLRDSRTSKETFTFSNTGLSTETINSITIFYYARWHNNQANSCFEAMLSSNGRDYFAGAQMCVGSSWEYVSYKYTENPSTNLPWTITEVDDLEAGMHSLNPNGGGRVAQVYAVVEYT